MAKSKSSSKTRNARTGRRRRSSAARERIDSPKGGPQYARRGAKGRFKEVESVGRSSRGDQRRDAKTESRRGQGDRGDRRTSTASRSRKSTGARKK